MKLFVLTAFVIALAAAQHHDEHKIEEYKDYRAHPHYNYHYGVHDLKTHDIKNQWETRDGHNTKGSYELQQPDGRKRIVEYEADKDGIHYKVKYEGHAIHWEGHKDSHQEHGHGSSKSEQYHKARTNYQGESHGHQEEDSYGKDLYNLGYGENKETSYENHVIHQESHGHY